MMMITNTKFIFIFGVLLLATSSLTFGDVQPNINHAAAAAAAGLRQTVRKLKSENSPKDDASMEQLYEFSQTKAKVLEQHMKAKAMAPETNTNQSIEAKLNKKKSKTSKGKNMTKKDKKKKKKSGSGSISLNPIGTPSGGPSLEPTAEPTTYTPSYTDSLAPSVIPESQIPESQVPESQVPESQVPESQVPESQVPDQSFALECGGVFNVLVAAPDIKSIGEVESEIRTETINVLQENNVVLSPEFCGNGVLVESWNCVISDCDSVFIPPAVTPDFVICYTCSISLLLSVKNGYDFDYLREAENIVIMNVEDGTFTKDLKFVAVLAGASDFTYVPTAEPTTSPTALVSVS
jgi:hypothetical protein